MVREKPPVVRKKREGQADDAVNCPPVQSPVKGRRGDSQGTRGPNRCVIDVGRILGGVARFCVIDLIEMLEAERRVLKVGHRLEHAKKQKPDSHACGKEHGKPCRVGIIGLCIFPTEAHLAEWRDSHKRAKEQDEVGGDHEQPIEIRHDPHADIAKHARRAFLKHEGTGDETDNGED